MKARKDNYHIKICPEFIFNPGLFKSRYAVWVYTHLKLDNNYYIQHNPQKIITINSLQIADRLSIDRTTVIRAQNELIDGGYLIKIKKGKYQLRDEKDVLLESGMDLSKTYVKVFNNFFREFYKNFTFIDALKIYLYLYYSNKKGKSNEEYEDIYFSKNKIAKELKVGPKKVKKAIDFLWNEGFLLKDSEGYYSIKEQFGKDKTVIAVKLPGVTEKLANTFTGYNKIQDRGYNYA